MIGCCVLLALLLNLNPTGGTEDDDVALTMEIAIETPNGGKREELIPDLASNRNCLSVKACQNGGVCRSAAVLADGTIRRGVCICPLGYSGPQCTEKVAQFRFPEILDGGFLAFGGWLLPKEGPFSVHLEITPYVLRPRTLILYHYSVMRGLAFYLESDDDILQLRVYKKSSEGQFHLSRLLQHPTKLTNNRGISFNLSFGLLAQGSLYLSVNGSEVGGRVEENHLEGGIDTLLGIDHPIFIGGHETLTFRNPFPILSAAENTFIGCVGDITINGHLCDPRQHPFVGDAVGGFGVADCSRNVCNHHACEKDGVCKPISSTKYLCQCPLGTIPPWCKKENFPIIPEFVGNSYLSLRGFKDTSWTETLLEITFLPKRPTGLIIYSGFSFDKRGDFICVSLVRGRIVVSLDLGRGPSFKECAQNVTLNSWHSLKIKRVGRIFDVYLDDQNGSSGPETFTQGDFVQLTIMDMLFVGGHPNPDHVSAFLPEYHELLSYKSVKGFTGCIQSLLLNGLRVDLVEDRIDAVNVVNCEMHECAKPFSPCGFNGKCAPHRSAWRCACKVGFAGSHCHHDISNTSITRMAFNGDSYLAKELVKSKIPNFSQTFIISADIRLLELRDVHEVLFATESIGTSKIQYIFLEVLATDGCLRLEIWDLPIGWPPNRPISSSFINYQSAFSLTHLSPSTIHKIVLSRNHTKLGVYVDGKLSITMDIHSFANHFYNKITFYIGGASQPIMDKLDFLQEMHPQVNKKGKIRGFFGCIYDIRLMDHPFLLSNATTSQNIDRCRGQK